MKSTIHSLSRPDGYWDNFGKFISSKLNCMSKKQLILGSFLALTGIMNAQQWQQWGGNFLGNGGLNNNNVTALEYLGTDNNYDLIFKTNAVENMRLATNGYLGIGSTAPGCVLQVIDNNSIGTVPEINLNSTSNSLTRFSLSSPNRTYYYSNDNTSAHLGYMSGWSYVDLINYNDQGRVGIGTNSPSEQFHTTGGVRFQGVTGGGSNLSVLTVDNNGKLWVGASGTGAGGVTAACSTNNNVPKFNSSGNLACSNIDDDGTTVMISGPSSNVCGFGGGQQGWLTNNAALPPTGSFNAALSINGCTKGLGFWATSDQRFKKDIRNIDNAVNIVKHLEGKTYYWRTEEFKDRNFNGAHQVGFIAQELEKIVPEAVVTDENGYKSVNYDMIIPILVEAIKEQQKQLDEQKEMINAQGDRRTGSATGISQLNSAADGFALDQNIPNPFSSETAINYTLPQQIKNASLIVYDLSGKQLTSFPLELSAKSISITSEKLSAGIYIYSIMADGKIMDSKRMVVADKQ